MSGTLAMKLWGTYEIKRYIYTAIKSNIYS